MNLRNTIFTLVSAFSLFVVASSVQPAVADSLNTTLIDGALGRKGQMLTGDVYKIAFPRKDLRVKVAGLDIKPGLALGSYAVFKQYGESTLMMGDLVLLPSEVESVLQSLERGGIQITALHNHLLEANPPVFYMHYMGMGDAGKLAGSLKRALALSGTPLGPTTAPGAPETLWFEPVVEQALSRQGTASGGVLAISVPRAADETMGSLTIPPAMGTWQALNFQDAGNKEIATTGDFALTADEVGPVIQALRDHNIDVEALHMHTLDDNPRLFYLHWWAVGDPAQIAAGLKAALDRVHTR